jgi:hypothetical protein
MRVLPRGVIPTVVVAAVACVACVAVCTDVCIRIGQFWTKGRSRGLEIVFFFLFVAHSGVIVNNNRVDWSVLGKRNGQNSSIGSHLRPSPASRSKSRSDFGSKRGEVFGDGRRRRRRRRRSRRGNIIVVQ